MSPPAKDPALYRRYLELLDVPAEPPSAAALGRLVRAQLTRVPFENVSKMYWLRRHGLRRVPDLALHLEGIARHRFGGTCYANNHHLCGLLRHLGYDASLRAADMASPGVHMVIAVSLAEGEYMVDVGNAAPFLSPFRLDLDTDQVVELGRDRWTLKPRDAEGSSRLEHARDGRLLPGYVVRPEARTLADFDAVVAQSFSDASVFMHALLAIRFGEGTALAIHNRTLIETRGREIWKTPLPGREAVALQLVKRFGMLREAAVGALMALDLGREVWD